MIKATIHEAKTHLSKLITEVESGKEVVLYRDKEPVARLVGLQRNDKKRPTAGIITSKPVHYSDDCFAPLTDEELREWGV
ncbi:MAG: type II toxin-antitoxin system Phd/YefM family antitoxin [Chthoniobacterales bacterium]